MLTPVDIEDRLNNLDHRLDRIEQILPTLASQEDLRQALEPYATKADLRQALEPYATKADLRQALEDYPTKTDLTTALAQAFELAEKNARILHEELIDRIKLLGEQPRRRR